jgi:pilus assembly protein HofN
MLSVIALALFWAEALEVKLRQQQALANALEQQQLALKALLVRQQSRLKENQRRREVLRAEAVLSATISRWEHVLNTLATRLPENSWLESVSWQNEIATVAGVAGDVRELGQIEKMLGALPGAFRVAPGELRDEQGNGLFFTFTLMPGGG